MTDDYEAIREFFRLMERDTMHYHAGLAALYRMNTRISKLEEAHEFIGIGGNHLASALIGWLGAGEATFPPYSTPVNEARKSIKDVDHYDAWVCWRSIMLARDAIRNEGTP